jgi:hypothetical protein
MAMFDTAQNRLSYSELLQPEIGYSLDFAVGLTYSLDLEALLGIPVSLGLLDEVDSELMRSPFYLLEAIRKSSDKLAVFCNAGGISLPNKIQSVYSLIENSVFEIKLANQQNFHPKMWVIKYKNTEGKAYIKFMVLSRNMTFDNSIDLCVAMQGDITRTRSKKNQPIADMLNFVAEYSDKSKKQRILELANDILHVKTFDIEHPFESYEFLPLGIEGHDKARTCLFDSKYDIFVVSPFLSDDIVKEITQCPNRKVLVTRKAAITKSVIESFVQVYVTKDILSDNEYGVSQDIHAKLYFTTTAEGNFLYIGSANASHNGFYKNVECLLKLKYKPRCMGFKIFFNDFIPSENCPYEIIQTVPDKPVLDEQQVSIDKAFKEVIYSIKGAKVSTNGDVYDIVIDTRAIKTKEVVKLSPLQRQDLMQNIQLQTIFQGLLLSELSEFYVLSIHDQKIVLKIHTKGIPTERDDAIYKSIINSKTKFLSYISFMISEDYVAGALEEAEYLRLMQVDTDGLENAPIVAAIYEKLLRLVHQSPSKLKEIADVIKRLDKDIIGEEFLDMYKQFELAARRLTR